MPQLPEQIQEPPIVRAIYAAYVKGHSFLGPKSASRRRYLGASVIGRACERALWYGFRWCGGEEHDGRMRRLLESGDVQELRLLSDLRAAGCEVVERDGDGQIAVSACGGHFGGHLDAAVRGVPEAPKAWHVAECKSHNAKSFADLRAKGVAASKPEHHAQVQVYMHLTGMERAVYLAVNKDTDELHAERVRYDAVEAGRLMGRALRVIQSPRPPERIAADPDDFRCKWCCHAGRCHASTPPAPAVDVDVTCRSCVHATPVVEGSGDGRWVCDKHNRDLTDADQSAACPDHLFIPELVLFAKQVDAGQDPAGDWVLYERPDGKTFANTKQQGGYASEELTRIPWPLVGDGPVEDLKEVFGAEVIDAADAPFAVKGAA